MFIQLMCPSNNIVGRLQNKLDVSGFTKLQIRIHLSETYFADYSQFPGFYDVSFIRHCNEFSPKQKFLLLRL